MILPKAPSQYDQNDQDMLRNALEIAISKLEQLPSGWTAWTGTAARGTQNADAPPTLTQVAQTLKALLDDTVFRVKT